LPNIKRKEWTPAEIQEIKKYFSRHFEIKDTGRIGNGLPIRWVEMKKGGL
jgi:hypothetical protein